MKFCPDCGCENIDDAVFCRNCGLKFNADVQKTSKKVVKTNQSPPSVVANNSIVSKLFYKTDKYTGELRFAKTKTISIGVFILMFLFSMSVGIEGASFIALLLTSIIFGLVFAVPVFVVGFILGLVIDRISH